jgi:protein disulfide-isomerase A1
LKKKTGPLSVEVNTKEDAEKYIADHELVGVFFGSPSSKAYADYVVVAGGHEDIVFIHSSNADVKSALGGHDDTFTLFKKFDEGKNVFSGPWNVESFRNFIDGHKHPTVIPFDQKAAQRIFGEGVNTLFLIVADNEAGAKAEAEFKSVANDLKDKIALSIAKLHEAMGQRLADYIGVTEAQTPALRIVLPIQDNKKFVHDGAVTADSIKHFVNEWTSGNLKPYFKSEPIPEHNNEPVKVIVGHSFNKEVLESDKHVLLEYYAPWCGHCKSLAPIYDALAKNLAHVHDLVIAKVDATANEIEGSNVRGFPTIKFYKKGDKHNPIDYEGDRTEEGFIEFLKQHGVKVTGGDGGEL